MSFRRLSLLALASALLACQDVKQEPPPAEIVIATFSPPTIPLPNDLALQSAPTLTAPELAAQKQLLQAFISAGGFPSDQEVPVTIPFKALAFDAGTGRYAPTAMPALDLATVTPTTVAVLKVEGTTPAAVAYDVAGFANGVLTLRKRADATGSRRWAPGRYVVAVRGGASGVKTQTGKGIQPDQAVALTLANLDLTIPANQPPGGLPAATAQLLEGVRGALWQPVTWSNVAAAWTPGGAAVAPAFVAVDAAFPHAETASIATFTIAPAEPVVLIDSGSGVAPLPIDLLRTGPNGTIAFNPAFGAAAQGLTTLDGFSTTGMMLAQTSVPVDAGTVTGANVHLFRIDGATATLVKELKRELGAAQAGDPTANPAAAGYVAEPTPIVLPKDTPLGPGVTCTPAGGCSPAIGLQPAALAPVPGVGTFTLPPLAEGTTYAVVITKRVKDFLGRPLAKPTVAKILLDVTAPVWAPVPGPGGTSLLSGVGAATARALQTMKGELAPVLAALPAGTTAADVVTAYTFKTQSVLGVSLKLAAAPYSIEAGAQQPIFRVTAAPTPVTPPAGVPTTNVAGFWAMTFNGIDAIDKTTGALRPTLEADLANPVPLLAGLTALVATPDPAAVPACAPPFAADLKCAKLVVFGHGLNGSKEQLFAVAASLASRGFIAAAVDFPLHGGRNWCAASIDCVVPGTGADGTCTPFAGAAGQGDAIPPGVCSGGSVPRTGDSRYFVSGNFFRIRDAFRQNLLDQSALVLALSRPPTGVPQIPAGQDALAAALPAGVIVDPSAVLYQGLSLGSISGTSVVATNPRIGRAALSVGGGTFPDIAVTSPAFQAQLAPLFTNLLASALPKDGSGSPVAFTFGMVRVGDPAFDANVAQAFLKLVNVAKWILDPGEAVNYAPHLVGSPLPNLLADPAGTIAQAPKETWSQLSLNDAVVPNATNSLLYDLIGGPQTLYSSATAENGTVQHGVLGTSAQVQADASGFLLDLTTPAAAITLP
jgi:hypothetical protein